MRDNAEKVLFRAIENGTLPHSIILHGEDTDTLENLVKKIARKLFGTAVENVEGLRDFHALHPAGKMRGIKVESTRKWIEQINLTTIEFDRKVAVIFDADRMHKDTANTILKTLEEPPNDTVIFLLTQKPLSLLPTIRSRCFQFYVPVAGKMAPPEEDWSAWLEKLGAWISMLLATPMNNKKHVADAVFGLYGLASEFEKSLDDASEKIWKEKEKTLPETLGESKADDEAIREAMEVAIMKRIRERRFAEMAETLCEIYRRQTAADCTRALCQSLEALEKAAGLLEVNYGATAAIEYILLRWMRYWSATGSKRK